ncbi:MAG: hypothetical protein Q7K65_04895 [Candidatus Buchananbacteria bacterium]|nr:hypothetical protein [Candidatus Buchananbacteria bacterium]
MFIPVWLLVLMLFLICLFCLFSILAYIFLGILAQVILEAESSILDYWRRSSETVLKESYLHRWELKAIKKMNDAIYLIEDEDDMLIFLLFWPVYLIRLWRGILIVDKKLETLQ